MALKSSSRKVGPIKRQSAYYVGILLKGKVTVWACHDKHPDETAADICSAAELLKRLSDA